MISIKLNNHEPNEMDDDLFAKPSPNVATKEKSLISPKSAMNHSREAKFIQKNLNQTRSIWNQYDSNVQTPKRSVSNSAKSRNMSQLGPSGAGRPANAAQKKLKLNTTLDKDIVDQINGLFQQSGHQTITKSRQSPPKAQEIDNSQYIRASTSHNPDQNRHSQLSHSPPTFQRRKKTSIVARIPNKSHNVQVQPIITQTAN